MSATAQRMVKREEPAPAPAAAEPRPGGKSRRGTLALGALAAVGLAGLGIYALLTRGQEQTDNAQVEADVVPLNIRVAGQVLHVRVQENARVHRGDVLVELDPRECASRVQQAEAGLDSARAQAEAAEA